MIVLYKMNGSTSYQLKTNDTRPNTIILPDPIIFLCESWDIARNAIIDEEVENPSRLNAGTTLSPTDIVFEPGGVVYIINNTQADNETDDVLAASLKKLLGTTVFGVYREIADDMLVEKVSDSSGDYHTWYPYRVILQMRDSGNKYLLAYLTDAGVNDPKIWFQRIPNGIQMEMKTRVYIEPNPYSSAHSSVRIGRIESASNAYKTLSFKNAYDKATEVLDNVLKSSLSEEGGCKKCQ